MIRLTLLAAAWLALIVAADAEPAIRGILTAAALIVGVVVALVVVHVAAERLRC